MMTRPAATRPTVTGDICRRPSCCQVARTAFSFSRRHCWATAISLVGLLLWGFVHAEMAGGPLSPCLAKSVAAITGDVPVGEREVHAVVQRGRPHSVVKPPYQEGATSKRTQGVAEVLCGTHPGLCMAYRRATIAPCPEALVASLRRTTIQLDRVLPGTAWRVDDAPQV
jgi:hypothetical protein